MTDAQPRAKGRKGRLPAAVVLRCADAGARVWSTLRSVERQTLSTELVLAADPSTPAGTRSWLRAVAESRGHGFVDAPGDRPAVVKNAGINAATAPLFACVDAGAELHPTFVEQSLAALKNRGAAAAATWVEWLGPGTRVVVKGVPSVTLAACASSSDVVDSTAFVRRRDWLGAGGFDESLEALEDLDLWLSLLSRGREIAVVPHPLVSYIVERDALYRRAWDPDRRARAMTRVLEKHASVFDTLVTGVLADREARLLPLAGRFRSLLARRDEGLAEIERTQARGRDLVAGAAASVPATVGGAGRATPIARDWGFSRGIPVDRYYINAFLEMWAADVRGAVLDVQEPDNARRVGAGSITRLDVIDVDGRNGNATVIADFRCAPNLASESYDCIVLTQTLHLIDDMAAVVAECARLLRPGGVVLATLPCASRIANDYGPAHDHWRVTAPGARRLFAEQFGSNVRVEAWGNVATTAAFLYGLAVHELAQATLDFADPHYPTLVTVRAQKG